MSWKRISVVFLCMSYMLVFLGCQDHHQDVGDIKKHKEVREGEHAQHSAVIDTDPEEILSYINNTCDTTTEEEKEVYANVRRCLFYLRSSGGMRVCAKAHKCRIADITDHATCTKVGEDFVAEASKPEDKNQREKYVNTTCRAMYPALN